LSQSPTTDTDAAERQANVFVLEEYKLVQQRIADQETRRYEVVKYYSAVFFGLLAATGLGSLQQADQHGIFFWVLLAGAATGPLCAFLLWRHYLSFSHWVRCSGTLLRRLAPQDVAEVLRYPHQSARMLHVYVVSMLLISLQDSVLLGAAVWAKTDTNPVAWLGAAAVAFIIQLCVVRDKVLGGQYAASSRDSSPGS
jgi:hypothetical protein